jgi:hypothetical protein
VKPLFWSGQSYSDSALKPVGRFKATQNQRTEASQIDSKSLRLWLKKAGTDIWDCQSHFKTRIAQRKKGKT